jgi:FkbM family methyltransferase
VLRHPLNVDRPLRALSLWLRWQIGSRIVPGAVAVPFVDDAQLLAGRGRRGANENVYTGLAEFEEMAFVLHLLRPGDLFVDVGANVGAYTILAAAVRGARCFAFEPVPSTFARLLENVRLNAVEPLVTTCNVALGAQAGTVLMTVQEDCTNHVVAERGGTATVEVSLRPLDVALGDACPVVMKVDVEGFESAVLAGAERTLRDPALRALVIELNGSGTRYGDDDDALRETIGRYGFTPYAYEPFSRALNPLGATRSASRNTLFVRDAEFVRERLREAPPFRVLGQTI